MRLTRLGWGCVLVAVLALMSAATTGNNLLYLLYSALLSSLILSAVAGWFNLRGVSARAEVPEMVFRATEFPLRIILRNTGRFPAFGIRACCRERRAALERIAPRSEAAFEIRYSFPHRGLNLVEDLVLESLFPFGLILHRRPVGGEIVGLALPRLREVHSAGEVRADARASGRPTVRKGMGEDLYGIREYAPADSSRLINWKLTAKTGRTLVNEFCASQDSKITVRVAGGAGEDAERRIEDAASACRFYIDTGAEVRLVTPEEELDYGCGLLHLDKLLNSLARLGEGKTPRSAGRPGKPAQTLVEDSKALRRLTLLWAALVYAAMFLIDDLNPWMLAALSGVLPLGFYLQERGGPRPPKSLSNVLSLGVLSYLLLWDLRASGVIVANSHLLVYLIANRALCEVGREGLGQVALILILGFFLVSGLTISLWYFTFFVLFLALAASWLMLASWAGPKSWRLWAGPGAGLLAAGLLLSAALFAATPRVEGLRRINPFIVAGIDKLQAGSSALTGFTENVSLGFFGELKRSSARVMRVRPPVLPAGRRAPALKIRGAVFDLFDGRRWSKHAVEFRYRIRDQGRSSTLGRGWALARGDQMFFPAPPPSEALAPYEFMIYPMGLSVLFTAGTPWLVEGIEATPYFDHTDSVYLPAPYLRGIRYRLYSNPGPAGFGVSDPNYERRMPARFLQLPPERDGRLKDLALRVTSRAEGDWGKARAVESFLQNGYAYSTFSDSRDRTLEDFLFSSMRGNCEYFATAAAVLLRHAGIPARLVTGFLTDEWNEYGKFYDVRQREAHAWVEAYVKGRGWVTLDPTPAGGAFSASADALGRRLERFLNAVQAEWYRRVIGYDQYVQRNTFRRLGLAVSPDRLLVWVKFALGIALLLVLAQAGGQGLKAFLKSLSGGGAGFFARAQAALERAGFVRERHLTPREYARRIARARPDLSALGDLAELHYRHFYSPRGLSPLEAEEARRLLRDIRSRV